MAEKGIRIADADQGTYVAFRDASEQDDGSNSRVIERVDFAPGKWSSPQGFPTRGNSRTRTFTSGGTYEVVVGNTLTGATSGATARVIAISITSGTWAGGDAAGTFTVCDQVGTFQSENLNVGANNDVATIAGNSSAVALSAAEVCDVTSLSADLLQNLIVVGDKPLLSVFCEISSSAGYCAVSPIVFDDESSPGVVTVLVPKVFNVPFQFRRGASAGDYICPVHTWDVLGAHRIGLHVSGISGTVKLWGRAH